MAAAEISTQKKLEQEVQSWIKNNDTSRALWDKINAKTATAQDCKEYSDALGREYSRLFSKYYPDIDMTRDSSEVRGIYETLQRRASYYTQQFVNAMNEAEGINIATQSGIDMARIDSAMDRLQQNSILNDGHVDPNDLFLFQQSALTNMAEAASSQTLENNAELQEDAGYKVKIIRHLGSSGCCDWCKSMAGTYDVQSARAAGAWAVHDNCDCWIEYRSAGVHQKISFSGMSKQTTDL